MSDSQSAPQSDRLAVLQLQVDNLKQQLQEVRATDQALVDLQMRNIKDQLLVIATRQETFAHSVGLEKLEDRVSRQDEIVAGIDRKVIPKEELQTRFDGVAAKQDSIVTSLNQLSQLVTKLREEVTASETFGRLEESRSNERRNRSVAVIATATAVASLVFSNFVHHGGGTNTVYVPTPVPITTTTVPGHP